jgi:hypothetical protein
MALDQTQVVECFILGVGCRSLLVSDVSQIATVKADDPTLRSGDFSAATRLAIVSWRPKSC